MKKSNEYVKKRIKYIFGLMNCIVKSKENSGIKEDDTAENSEKKDCAEKFEFKKYVKDGTQKASDAAQNEQNNAADKEKPSVFSQKSVIKAILEGNDVIANIPTGGGKTLCYQAPALCMEGITLVISPLQALCRDQVNNFNDKYKRADIKKFNQDYKKNHPESVNLVSDKIPQALYNASIDDLLSEKSDKSGKYDTKLLYLSPEKLDLEKFKRDFLEAVNSGGLTISRIVFDEAHCVFMWGFDFRESYLKICSIVNQIKKEYRPPIAAFSATFTAGDYKLLKQLFDMKSPRVFRGSAIRDDLDIFMLDCNKEKEKIGEIKGFGGSIRLKCLHDLLEQREKYHKCIIYCSTKYQIRVICKKLDEWNEKWEKEGKPEIKFSEYHGDLFRPQRKRTEKKFSTEDCDIVIATTAFGMGIDNNQVDLVIHFDIPASIEDYYQQIGRAGRNPNLHGKTVLLYEENGEEDGECEENGKWKRKIHLNGTREFAKKNISDKKHLNDIYSGNVMTPRLNDSAKKALAELAEIKFEYLVKYLDENLEKVYNMDDDDDFEAENAPDFGEELFGITDFNFIKCSQNIIKEYFNEGSANPDILKNTSIVLNDVRRILRLSNELHAANALIANNIRKYAVERRTVAPGAYTGGKEIEVLKIEPVSMHSPEKIRKIKGFCFYDNTVEWRRKKEKPENEKSILKIDIRRCSGFLYVHSATFDNLKIMNYAQKVWEETEKLKNSGQYLYIFTDVPNIEEEKSRSKKARKSENSYLTAMVFKKIGQISGETDKKENRLQLIGYSEDILKQEEKFLKKLKKSCADKENLDEEDLHAVNLLEKKPNRLVGKAQFDQMVEKLDSGNKEERSQNRIFIIDEAKKSSESAVLWYSDGTPYTENPLTYFDMCVADAIYTIELNGDELIYPLTIWRILSGNENLHFSRSGSQIKAAVEASIEKMRALNIRIIEGTNGSQAENIQVSPQENNCFLPLLEVENRSHVYKCDGVMPLYSYCEKKKNGHIIKLPAYRLDGRRHRKLLPQSPGEMSKHQIEELTEEMKETTFLNPQYRCTLESAVMYHYLQRRISIYRHTNRSGFINLNTLAAILHEFTPEYHREDLEYLKKRAESYLFWCLPKPNYKNSGTVQFENYGYLYTDSFGIKLYKDICKKNDEEKKPENDTDSDVSEDNL